MQALALLSGDAQAFVDKAWASHIHVHHADPAELVGLLSLDDVDHLLTSTALRTPALRLAKDGNVLPASSYTRAATLAGAALTGLVDARKLLDLFADGATVVLQGMHRYWPPLAELVRDLELSLGHPCQANAYLTPPGAQGFDVHSDTHDVFVFQTHGTKQWEVHDESGPRELLLEPGVSMYLPTGTPHAARAQAAASLHVTIGIKQVTWRQVLQRLSNRLLEAEMYDAPVPAGYLEDAGAFAEGLSEHIAALSTELTGLDPAAMADEQARQFLTTRTPLLRGGLVDRLSLAGITTETRLVRRPGTTCVLDQDQDEGRLLVLLGDRAIRTPLRLAEPLGFVSEQAELRPRDLHRWLDPDSSLILARRLVREGLLRVEG